MANFSLLAKIGVDTKAFTKGMNKAKRSAQGFASNLKRTVGPVIASIFAVQGIKNIINLGLAAEETASKFKAVFGPAADEMDQKIQDMAKTIPATVQQLQETTSTIFQMTNAMGLPVEASKLMSVELTRLGSDLASFNNQSPEEIFLKMRSAIVGEFEPLKSLGIAINDARLQSEALKLGIEKQGATFTAAQKAMLVFNIINSGSSPPAES